MNELKPCPFCGRKPELRRDDDGFSYIVCANDNCYVRTDGHLNDNAAIKAWNTRKPIDKVLEGLEELRDTATEAYGIDGMSVVVAICNAIEIVKKGGVE